jgi:hypothetical protein
MSIVVRPMPSPRGTNAEGRYLVFRTPMQLSGRGAAYDAARDAEEDAELEKLRKVMDFLQTRLEPGDLDIVMKMLEPAYEFTSEDGEVESPISTTGDQPPPFKGRPTPGGKPLGQDALRKLAFDAAAKRYEKKHPAMDEKMREHIAKMPGSHIRILG